MRKLFERALLGAMLGSNELAHAETPQASSIEQTEVKITTERIADALYNTGSIFGPMPYRDGGMVFDPTTIDRLIDRRFREQVDPTLKHDAEIATQAVRELQAFLRMEAGLFEACDNNEDWERACVRQTDEQKREMARECTARMIDMLMKMPQSIIAEFMGTNIFSALKPVDQAIFVDIAKGTQSERYERLVELKKMMEAKTK